MNVYHFIARAASLWPTSVAIYDEYGSITFEELHHQIENFTQQLIKAGVEPGSAVGVMARNSRQFIIGIFAGLGANATVMPLSHQMRKSEIDQVIADAGLHYLIDDKSMLQPPLATYTELPLAIGAFRFALTGNKISLPYAPHINNPAFIRFTSGTTGKSKGVIVSHQSVLERIQAANKALNLGNQDTVVWVLPMAYHFMVSIVLYIYYGTAIAITKDFLGKTIVDYTNRFKGTLLYAAPMHIRMLATDTSGATLDSLRMVISTSAAILPEACRQFQERYGVPVSQAYGIIEIGLPIINHEKSAENPEAVGHALPDYQVEILDNDFAILPTGTTGKLAIKGPGMFDGYLTPPQTREEVLHQGWFMTGDLATKNEDGLITVVGREKSMINVSGNKVFPEEVEHVLHIHPAVELAKIYGNKHPLLGEIVEAKIMLKKEIAATSEELIIWCRQRLSTYKVPQVIHFVESIEMTGSGKVVRY